MAATNEIIVRGQAWVFGDNIDTDALAPGAYMKGGLVELAAHCLETHDSNFATQVKPGDILVAGENFGIGSSREQAAQALQELGVGAVIARSFGGIFYRNAINIGLIVVQCDATAALASGQWLLVDPQLGTIQIEESDTTLSCDPLPAHLLEMIKAGGLIAHLHRQMSPNNGIN